MRIDAYTKSEKSITVNPYQTYELSGWHNIKVNLIHWVLLNDLYSRFTMKGPASITPHHSLPKPEETQTRGLGMSLVTAALSANIAPAAWLHSTRNPCTE